MTSLDLSRHMENLAQRQPLALPPDALTIPGIGRVTRHGNYETRNQLGGVWFGPKRLTIIASFDETPHFGSLLHVSLSYPDRDPDWTVIRAVRDTFFPSTLDVMMVLPRAEDYVSGVPGWPNSHVFHLWQCPEKWGIR